MSATTKPMGKVTTTIVLVNRIDQILADRGFPMPRFVLSPWKTFW